MFAVAASAAPLTFKLRHRGALRVQRNDQNDGANELSTICGEREHAKIVEQTMQKHLPAKLSFLFSTRSFTEQPLQVSLNNCLLSENTFIFSLLVIFHFCFDVQIYSCNLVVFCS